MNIALIIFNTWILYLTFLVFTVKQQSSVIVERFGKFHSVRQSGLH
jgi:regulator of protease activity HflC (stomatin/prohibitin superfamily)